MRIVEFKPEYLSDWSRVTVTKEVAHALRNEYLSYGWSVRVYEYL